VPQNSPAKPEIVIAGGGVAGGALAVVLARAGPPSRMPPGARFWRI